MWNEQTVKKIFEEEGFDIIPYCNYIQYCIKSNNGNGMIPYEVNELKSDLINFYNLADLRRYITTEICAPNNDSLYYRVMLYLTLVNRGQIVVRVKKFEIVNTRFTKTD